MVGGRMNGMYEGGVKPAFNAAAGEIISGKKYDYFGNQFLLRE
jgi:hypothetical protein